MKTTVDDCSYWNLPKMSERCGALTPVYGNFHIPFPINRIYYIYDVPGGESRGGHAHKELQQMLVSVMGAFDVVVNDGVTVKTFRLERANYGLYIPQMIWRELINFSSGGICLVLTSSWFEENDYIRKFENFLVNKNSGPTK